MIIKRRIQKYSQACREKSDCDIAVQTGQALLLDYWRDEWSDLASASKGLLFYEHDVKAIKVFSDSTLIWDQIPFAASSARMPEAPSGVAAGAYEVLISNLAFDWLDAGLFIAQISDLLAEKGVFWFTAYGAGTAITSRAILSELDQYAHFNDFYEMQEIGDALAGAGFKEVSLSTNVYTLEYTSVEVLMADAYRLFGANQNKQRRRGLGGRTVLKAFKDKVAAEIKEKGVFSEKIELVVAYGRKAALQECGSTIPVKVGS